MRTIYLLLLTLVCLASAKYLPNDRFTDQSLQWRYEGSTLDEPDTSSDSSDDDGDEDPAKQNEEKQKFLEKLAKDKRKQEEEWRKYEEKIEEEKRKFQEKLDKEQRKLQEKIEKEKRKQAESEKKLQEKVEKEERKRQEKIKKELEKNTLKSEKQSSLTDVSTDKESESIDLESVLKQYVYEKYGLNSDSPGIERKAALYRYLQEETGLNANNTKSEQRQALIQLIQTKLQNESSENSLKNYLVKNLTPTEKANLETKLRQNIEKLDNETNLINNVKLPGIKTAQQNIDEKKTLLQVVLQFLSTSFTGQANTNPDSLDNTSGNGISNEVSGNTQTATNPGESSSSATSSGFDTPNPLEPGNIEPKPENGGIQSNEFSIPIPGSSDTNKPTIDNNNSSDNINSANPSNTGNTVTNGDLGSQDTAIPNDSNNLAAGEIFNHDANSGKPATGSTDALSSVSEPVDSVLTSESDISLIPVSASNSKPSEAVVGNNDGSIPSPDEVTLTNTDQLPQEIQDNGNNSPVPEVVNNSEKNTQTIKVGAIDSSDVSPAMNETVVGSDQNTDNVVDAASNPISEANTAANLVTESSYPADLTVSASTVTDSTIVDPAAQNPVENIKQSSDSSLNIDPSNELSSPSTAIHETNLTGEGQIATDSSSSLPNTDTFIPQTNFSNGNDKLSSTQQDNVVSNDAPSGFEHLSTSAPIEEQTYPETTSNNLLDVTPSNSDNSKNGIGSLLESGIAIGSQNTEGSPVAPDNGKVVSEAPNATDTLTKIDGTGNSIDNNPTTTRADQTLEAWGNETGNVLDVNEPVTNVSPAETSNTDTTLLAAVDSNKISSTQSSIVSDVTIPEETGATVVDVVPQ